MIIGIFINEIGRLVFANPFSLNLILLSINIVILVVSLLTIRHQRPSSLQLPRLKPSEKLITVLLIISFFSLGYYGTVTVIVSGNSSLLLLLIIACSIAVSSIFLSRKISTKLYPLILLIVSLCMIFFASGTLITKYISGTGDGPIEFYAFRLTERKGYWDPTVTSSPYAWNLFPTYSMLSVTILPMIFSVITGADGSLVFNLIYPFVIVTLCNEDRGFFHKFYFFRMNLVLGEEKGFNC